jgi:LacI family transcriptional regulator
MPRPPLKPSAGPSCSITALAKSAGVSVATVSRAFNHADRVAPETLKRVLAEARRLGYTPDPRFRLMGGRTSERAAEQRTHNLGLLLGHRLQRQLSGSDPFYGRLMAGIEERARDRDYHILISRLGAPDDPMLPRCIADLKVDGVLLTSDAGADLIERIRRHVPVVLVNAHSATADVPSVMPDERQTVSLLLDHLRGLGHRRITYVHIEDADPPNPHMAQRCEAFRQLTGDLPEAHVEVLPTRRGGLEDVMRSLLVQWRERNAMPTALLCGGDAYAVAAIHAAHDLRIAIPDELSVTGIDDTVSASSIYPKLTSVRQPLEAIGAAAVDMLLDRIERPLPVECRVLGVELITRMSTQAVKGHVHVEQAPQVVA